MRIAIKTLSAALFSLIFAAGCGQKGALFLPDDPSTISTNMPSQAEAQPAAEDEDEQDNEDNNQ